MTSALVTLSSVGMRFDNGLQALSGLDLTLHDGEFLALLGPSGCGKSTALRLIAGLSDPSAGHVERAPEATPMGFVFQDPTLMPWRRAARNVALPLQVAGVSSSDAASRAKAALARVGLSGFERAFPRELSGGMRMRVSIARALVTNPRLLLMDEPFAALDEIGRLALNADLRALHEMDRLATVFVTHSVAESVFLADRILIFSPRPGRVMSEIRVEAPAQRNTAWRESVEFLAICQRASQALRVAMGEAA